MLQQQFQPKQIIFYSPLVGKTTLLVIKLIIIIMVCYDIVGLDVPLYTL